jgi:RimJ/RimL family protein N-acetyltransferase
VLLRSVSESEILLAGADSDLELARDARCFRKSARDELTSYFGLCTESGDLIGHVILQKEDAGSDEALLGIHIFRPGNRRRGYGSDAVAVICRHGFEDLGLQRIVLRVHEDNLAARWCYEKSGFRHTARVADDPDMMTMALDRREEPNDGPG